MAVTKYVNDLDFEVTLKKKWLFEMFEVTLFCLTLKKDHRKLPGMGVGALSPVESFEALYCLCLGRELTFQPE